ncbi:Hypothetical_protein [Hexamita inflata]|uniref:Hypothetical_protein n=1 Tax=Hexamita inflata TaxID=28002 RepID=A0AA86TVM9_9EUKA|nr:Hypothetical protein HINF_LOCUS10968 [Hexamita inflata]
MLRDSEYQQFWETMHSQSGVPSSELQQYFSTVVVPRRLVKHETRSDDSHVASSSQEETKQKFRKSVSRQPEGEHVQMHFREPRGPEPRRALREGERTPGAQRQGGVLEGDGGPGQDEQAGPGLLPPLVSGGDLPEAALDRRQAAAATPQRADGQPETQQSGAGVPEQGGLHRLLQAQHPDVHHQPQKTGLVNSFYPIRCIRIASLEREAMAGPIVAAAIISSGDAVTCHFQTDSQNKAGLVKRCNSTPHFSIPLLPPMKVLARRRARTRTRRPSQPTTHTSPTRG